MYEFFDHVAIPCQDVGIPWMAVSSHITEEWRDARLDKLRKIYVSP